MLTIRDSASPPNKTGENNYFSQNLLPAFWTDFGIYGHLISCSTLSLKHGNVTLVKSVHAVWQEHVEGAATASVVRRSNAWPGRKVSMTAASRAGAVPPGCTAN